MLGLPRRHEGAVLRVVEVRRVVQHGEDVPGCLALRVEHAALGEEPGRVQRDVLDLGLRVLLDEVDSGAAGVERIDGCRAGGLDPGEVRGEVGGGRERGEGRLAVGVRELPTDLPERVGEPPQLVPATLVVRADRVDGALHVVADVLGDRGPGLVGEVRGVPDPGDVLEFRSPVGTDERHLRLVEQGGDPGDGASTDDAGERGHPVLLEQFRRRRDRGLGAVALVGDDEVDLSTAEFAVVGVQVELEAVADLRADRLVRPGQRGEQADLYRAAGAGARRVVAAGRAGGQHGREQRGGEGTAAPRGGERHV